VANIKVEEHKKYPDEPAKKEIDQANQNKADNPPVYRGYLWVASFDTGYKLQTRNGSKNVPYSHYWPKDVEKKDSQDLKYPQDNPENGRETLVCTNCLDNMFAIL
jgi:hypothetical protein